MQKELMEKSLEFCAHIPHLMGLEAHVLDKEKPDAFCGDCPRNGFCAGCTYQNKEEMKPHIYGLHEAYRWQGKYMYYCPIGLMFGAFALLDGQGELAGGLIVGPLVVDDGSRPPGRGLHPDRPGRGRELRLQPSGDPCR